MTPLPPPPCTPKTAAKPDKGVGPSRPQAGAPPKPLQNLTRGWVPPVPGWVHACMHACILARLRLFKAVTDPLLSGPHVLKSSQLLGAGGRGASLQNIYIYIYIVYFFVFLFLYIYFLYIFIYLYIFFVLCYMLK